MSGHSKWATTKRQKGAADAKRAVIFTKLGKAITVAAKLGGGDMESNFKLRLAVDLAKAANLPKDNIERAIKRGTGELGGGTIEQIVYEGFGPAGTAFIIEALTDNRNRSSSSVKHILTKYGGSLGVPGSVSWLFEQKGIIRIQEINDELELELIDIGLQDFAIEEGGVTIYTAPADLKKVKDFLEKKGIAIEYAEIEQVAKDKKQLNPSEKETMEKLITELETNEDVNNYYTNAD
ncbi:MAG: YebC/PmpR family DNA-binding transcriptional regulator [Patescibacteria group bacterium]